MAYKYPGCESCYFHDREPAICESCEDESEFSPNDDSGDGEDGDNDLGLSSLLEEIAA